MEPANMLNFAELQATRIVLIRQMEEARQLFGVESDCPAFIDSNAAIKTIDEIIEMHGHSHLNS